MSDAPQSPPMPPMVRPRTLDSDETRRVRRMVHEEIDSTTKLVKRIQFWVMLAILVAGGGFAAAMYLTRYATGTELEKVADMQALTARELQQHIASEAGRLGGIEATTRNVEADYHWQREQLTRIADRVGAARVAPPPSHATFKPAPPEENAR